jgi:hypothetical protein
MLEADDAGHGSWDSRDGVNGSLRTPTAVCHLSKSAREVH